MASFVYDLVDDAGHGGKDPGAVSQFGHEEDWTLKITLYQYKRFKELGINVGLTRDEDETLTEDQRVALAAKGRYCISNHLNAGGGDRAEVVHSIYSDGKLANLIKEQLLAVGQTAVKVYCRQGTNGDYYYMHRRTGATETIIVEYCFIDNGADFEHFKVNWEAYAEATVRAFCSHIGHPYKPKNTPAVAPQKITKEEDEMPEKAIVVTGYPDLSAAEILQGKLGDAGIHFKKNITGKKVAKHLFVVGGNKDGLVADKFTVLSGANRLDTLKAVWDYK